MASVKILLKVPQRLPIRYRAKTVTSCHCLKALPALPPISFPASFHTFPPSHTSIRLHWAICRCPNSPCSLLCYVFTHFSSYFSTHRTPTHPSSLSSRVASSWKPSLMSNLHSHPGRVRGCLPPRLLSSLDPPLAHSYQMMSFVILHWHSCLSLSK